MSNEFRDVIEPKNSYVDDENPRPIRPIPKRKVQDAPSLDIKSMFEESGYKNTKFKINVYKLKKNFIDKDLLYKLTYWAIFNLFHKNKADK